MSRKSRYDKSAEIKNALDTAPFIAGIYLRLSVEDGDDLENNSIGNQKKIARTFLANRTDIVPGGIYVDHGRTGMNYKRPGFLTMLADLEDGKINCIIVKDISRLGRNYILTSEYVEKIFPDMGVRLICVNDAYDSLNPGADHDSLLMPFKLIMNDTYVKDTSRKIRSSIDAKVRRGEFLPSSSSVPYGYQRVPEEITYSLDPETAPVVKRIFEMRASGMLFNTIANVLNDEGILCPGKLRYNRGLNKSEKYKDALWIRGTIRKMTNDPVYIGNRIHGKIKRDRLGGDKTRRSPEEWKVFENAHPPIVSEELFQKVQEFNQAELERRKNFAERKPPELDFREIFLGKVFCGDCGGLMSARKRVQRATSPRPNSIFYDCNEYHDSNGKRCHTHYIRQEALMEALKHLLDQQVQTAVEVERLMSEVRQSPTQGRGDHQNELLSLRNRRSNMKGKLERLLEDVAVGVLDREEYLQIKATYLEELAVIEARLKEVENQQEDLQEAFKSTETWLKAIKAYQAVPVVDRALVDILVEKILVFDNKNIRFCLTYSDPYAPLAAHLEHSAERGGLRAG